MEFWSIIEVVACGVLALVAVLFYFNLHQLFNLPRTQGRPLLEVMPQIRLNLIVIGVLVLLIIGVILIVPHIREAMEAAPPQ